MQQLLSIAQQTLSENSLGHLPEWFTAAMVAYQAGRLTRKQKRKLKWKLAWEMVKSKLPFRKKEKGKNTALKIIVVLLILATFGFAIWLGIIKELLILLGAVILFFVLFMSAAKRG